VASLPAVVSDPADHLPHTAESGTPRLPAALAGLDPGRAGVRALAAFAAVVAVVAAVVAWQARPDVEPVGRTSPPTDATGTLATASPTSIVVAVSGRVRRPGLVRLPAGARVADAIEAAGGVLTSTDLSLVNLARRLTDGELIVIGLAAPSVPVGPGGAGQPAGAPGPVNLNAATLDQLQELPGVGPVLAQRIIDYRQAHGGFASVADLRKVSGIGDARFNELKDRVTV
jgi:competence protein ComEA